MRAAVADVGSPERSEGPRASSITALAPWFGSKRTLAPRIVEAIGPHSVYWEPFCGSMAVLFAKARCRVEIVNDLHGDLVNLARVIQHPIEGPAIYRRLRRVLCSQAEFEQALAAVKEPDPQDQFNPDRAFHYFVASWQGMNGVAGTATCNTNFAKRFSSGGGDNGTRWRGAVESIPQFRRRLERVQILRSDGVGLCERIEDKAGTVLYVDPPYLVKGSKYLHDFEAADHRRLALALNRFEATRVVVSYYDHPDLAALYPGWQVRRHDVSKGMVNSGKRGQEGRTSAPEVLLINHPSTEPHP